MADDAVEAVIVNRLEEPEGRDPLVGAFENWSRP